MTDPVPFLHPVDPAQVSLRYLKRRVVFLMERAASGAADGPVAAGWSRCFLCRREFEKGQTDEEALAEYERRFGTDHGCPEYLLCTDYDRIVAVDQGIAPAGEDSRG